MTTLLDVIVKKRHVEAENVVVIEFESASATQLPKVEAGAHIDVHLPNGMVRQYSLCQDPTQTGIFRLGILHDQDARGGSRSVFDDIQQGTELQVSTPRNLFPLMKAKHTLLIGGGIGITPLITMAYQLAHDAASFELHYCGSSPERCAFVEELTHGKLAAFTQFHFKSEGDHHRRYFETAFLTIDPETHIYTCGPNGFMDWVINLALMQHIPAQNIHKEYFQVKPQISNDTFEVVAQRSSKVIRVGADETILHALIREGINVEMSCEQGICGTCMCNVLEGEPDHRDVYLKRPAIN